MIITRAAAGLFLAIALCTVPGVSLAGAQQVDLNVGDPAPRFDAISDDGTPWRSVDHVGSGFLVVYFYPAAMTDGCTAQACSFRDNRSRLQELGATVVGVSGDRVENLRAFKGSNRLNFPLLSDTGGAIAAAFGVPVRAGGQISRTGDGAEVQLTRDVTAARWTFIIAPDGRIAYKATQVDPEGDGPAVMAAIRRLTRSR
jgi:thioredoxin-dependent peroxiredoxin